MQKAKSHQTTIDAVLYTYFERKKDKKHPVKVRVIDRSETHYYSVQVDGVNLFLSKDEWVKVMGEKPRSPYREHKDIVDSYTVAAKEAWKVATRDGKMPFTFKKFEDEFVRKQSKKTITQLFEDKIAELLKAEKIGTYISYKNAFSALQAFRKKPLMPEDITVPLLRSFESFLKSEKKYTDKKGNERTRPGAGKTTIGMYQSALRSIYNEAALDNPDLTVASPFASKKQQKGKYTITKKKSHKGQALSVEQWRALAALELVPNTTEWIAQQWFMFSCWVNGINSADMALLRYENIDIVNRTIWFFRKKTESTSEDSTPVIVPLEPEMEDIILKLGQPKVNDTTFVFGVVDDNMDAVTVRKKIQLKIALVNAGLKKISVLLGTPKITTYWARHTFASHMNETGASTSEIQEALGHGDIRTTQNYVGRFKIEKKRETMEKRRGLMKAS